MRRYRVALVGILLCCLSVALFCGVGRAEKVPWDCPECGRTGITRNYCGGCGHPAPWIEGESEKLSRDDFSKVGNIVRFGHYEQDNNLDNGSEEIEWIVLDVQEGKSLLLSKYGLDAKAYNATSSDVTWETCILRNWLNSAFLNAAFSLEEQFAILKTDVSNSRNQGYSGYNTSGGNTTKDKIFLLSYQEAYWRYLKNNDERVCLLTDFANGHNDNIEANGRRQGPWWLRSPGFHSKRAMLIDASGGGPTDDLVDVASVFVRPAFWINLESNIF